MRVPKPNLSLAARVAKARAVPLMGPGVVKVPRVKIRLQGRAKPDAVGHSHEYGQTPP